MDFISGIKLAVRIAAIAIVVTAIGVVVVSLTNLIGTASGSFGTFISTLTNGLGVAFAVANFYLPFFNVIWLLFVAWLGVILVGFAFPLIQAVYHWVLAADQG